MSHMVHNEAVEVEANQVSRHPVRANRRLDHHAHLGMVLLLVRHLLPPLLNEARRGIMGTTRAGCVSGNQSLVTIIEIERLAILLEHCLSRARRR
jgi:hypothetical protein